MATVDDLAGIIVERSRDAERYMVAIAGAPGAGKSTASQRLAERIPGSAIVEADGFHYDNALLDALGRSHRKGAPDTFDCRGLELTLARLRAGEDSVLVPIFDRDMDVARGSARMIDRKSTTILVEGNYLAVDRQPWAALGQYFDFTVFVEVPEDELVRRLVRRWTELGATAGDAEARVKRNDLPNIEFVRTHTKTFDFAWRHRTEATGAGATDLGSATQKR